jgi:outer membrane protein TolC
VHSRRAAIAQAQTDIERVDRERWPDPVLGVQLSREGSAGSPANYIVLGTLGLALPVSQTNQGARAHARVDESMARLEERATVRELRSRIASAHAALVSAQQRLALYASGITSSLEANLVLLRKGFEAGEIPLLTIAVARERFLQAQHDVLNARADYYCALTDLELALGGALPAPIGATTGGAP